MLYEEVMLMPSLAAVLVGILGLRPNPVTAFARVDPFGSDRGVLPLLFLSHGRTWITSAPCSGPRVRR